MMADAGLVEICEPLVEFFTLALVKPSATLSTPFTVQTQVGVSGYVPSLTSISYQQEHVLYRDLADLQSVPRSGPGDPAMLGIARSVRDVVSEARDERTNRAKAREIAWRPHTMGERLSDTIVDRLLLMYRTADDNNLPLLYHEWAARPRGVLYRWVFQQTVEVACAALNKPYFEVTLTESILRGKINYELRLS
jgi:hypothetical protein